MDSSIYLKLFLAVWTLSVLALFELHNNNGRTIMLARAALLVVSLGAGGYVLARW